MRQKAAKQMNTRRVERSHFSLWQEGLKSIKLLSPEVLESAGLFQTLPGLLYQGAEWMATELSELILLSPWL